MTNKNETTKEEILTLASEFRKRRTYLGISQLALSKHANISQSIINKLESGKIDPTYSTVLKINKALLKQEKLSNLTAIQIMIPKDKIVYLKHDTKLSKVVDLIHKYNYSQFTVLDEKRKLIGVIYEKTIFNAISNKVDIHKTTIQNYIEPNPILVPPQYDITDLIYIFENPNTQLVLVGHRGRILGLITKSDLFKKHQDK